MQLALTQLKDRDVALRNGGQVIATYPDGWLIEVEATRVGAVTYQLHDGSVIRLYAPADTTLDAPSRS